MRHLNTAAALAAIVVLANFTVSPAPAAEVIATQAGPVNVESLAKLEHPYGMTFLPDGRLLITEKPGRLRIYGTDGKLSEPVAGVPEVAFKGQGGMLDVAIDPDFKSNQIIYLSFTEAAEQQPEGAKDEGDHRLTGKSDDNVLKGGAVARGKLDGDKLSDVKVIWRQEPKTIGRGHYACRMIFGSDGKLFITSGERQRFEPALDLNTNLGKVVRINPDGSIPKDNPFAGKGRDDLWTMGNRNPLGIAFDGAGKLWVNEMGPKGGDELNLLEPGKNYGWPAVASKATHYDNSPIPEHSTKPEFEAPDYAWTPVISPSGMIFYNGSQFAGWRGNAFIGGLSSKALVRVQFDLGKPTADEKIDMKRRIRDVIEAPDGAVLLLSDGPNAELLRLTPVKSASR